MSNKLEESSEQKSSIYDKEELTEAQKFKQLDDWLRKNGAKYPDLELQDYGSEVRGCHAKRDIKEEEVIITIPLKCLITVEMGKETDVGRAILASNIELDAPKHIFLMLFMLIDQKNPNSFFRPYYNILPKTLYNMPIFWTEEELKYLEGSYMLQQIEERNIAIESDYAAICMIVPHFPDIATIEEFRFARMCVCSRNFGLIINGVRTAALVPYADMLNHYRPRETKWQFDDAVQGFTVTSVTPIRCGAQVYDSYGQKCNHRFLLNYGFSVENNVEPDGYSSNEVPLLLQLKRSDSLYDLKMSTWRRDSVLPSRRIRVSVGDNDNFRMLLSILRIIEADKDDVDQLLRRVGAVPSSGSNSVMLSSFRSIRDAQTPINSANEIRAMHHLETLCVNYLSKYPSSYEVDIRRLTSHIELPLYSNERHAVIQVKGEKEVLRFYLDLATTSQRLLIARDIRSVEAEMSRMLSQKSHVVYDYIKNNVYKVLVEEQSRHGRKSSSESSPAQSSSNRPLII